MVIFTAKKEEQKAARKLLCRIKTTMNIESDRDPTGGAQVEFPQQTKAYVPRTARLAILEYRACG